MLAHTLCRYQAGPKYERDTAIVTQGSLIFRYSLSTARTTKVRYRYPLIKGDGGVAGADADAGLLRTVQYAVAFGFPGY